LNIELRALLLYRPRRGVPNSEWRPHRSADNSGTDVTWPDLVSYCEI